MEFKTIILKYLSITSSQGMDEEARVEALIVNLDELALLYHEVQYQADEVKHAGPPGLDYKECYARVGALFPSLGFYNTVLEMSENIGDPSVGVGDAIDDIVDIRSELLETIWRYENTSENDALRHFKTLFVHWGEHMRELQCYLHDRTWSI